MSIPKRVDHKLKVEAYEKEVKQEPKREYPFKSEVLLPKKSLKDQYYISDREFPIFNPKEKHFSQIKTYFNLWQSYESDERLWFNLNGRLNKNERRMRRP